MMILLPTKEIANSIQPATPDEVDTGAAIDGDVFTKVLVSNYALLLSLTILKCLHSECWITVWSSPFIIDCCNLYRVAGEWSQSRQHMLSAPLSCNVHNGGAIAVAQSVSGDESSLVRAGYCTPHYE